MTADRPSPRGPKKTAQDDAFPGSGFDGPFYPGMEEMRGARYWVHDALAGEDRENVLAHEVGHVIAVAAMGPDGIPLTGAQEDFDIIYHMLNARGEPSRSDPPQRRIRPEDLGYRSEESDFEKMAEAIRLYMQNPSYIKEYFPNAARRIRKYVNTNSRVNHVIQFN